MLNSNLWTASVNPCKTLISPLRGLGTNAFWLSFVEKKGAVKASATDTDALIKMIMQVSPVYALAFVALSGRASHIT